MSEKSEVKPTQKPQILNEEALKGVWVDGIGIQIGPDYVIIEGVISKPRADPPYVVSRIMFPTRILEQVVKSLSELWEKHKDSQKKSKPQT